VLFETAASTWELGFASEASTYGNGCGSPNLSLSPINNARPTINTTAGAALTNVPSSLAFVALGWSRTAYGPFALPLALAGFGMPGCDLLQSSEVGALPTTATGSGTASFSLPLPNLPALLGLYVYLQAFAYAPGANPSQVVLSNGVEWRIGDS
jgi:hypothetical protein